MRRRSTITRVLLLAAITLAWASLCGAGERFPQPQFESGYTIPTPTTPLPRVNAMAWLDTAALALALALAAWFALRQRSRDGLFCLSVFAIAYFGVIRAGCICPVGSLQNVALALADPGYGLPLTVLAFFLLPLVMALFFGRVFCAGVCPLGAIQDVVVIKPLALPPALAHGLAMFRYVYLGLAVLLAATGTSFVVCRLDPFVGLFRLSGNAGMLAAGGAILVLGTVIGRPYCRFLCPYGVLLGWTSWLSARHVSITPDECVQCRLCEDACPYGMIRTPTTTPSREPRRRGVRRLAILFGVMPVLALTGAWAGSRLAPALVHFNEDAQTAERIRLEEAGIAHGTTVTSRAFRSTGEPVEMLFARVALMERRLARGGLLLGAFLAIGFSLKLLTLSVQRERHDYEPDRAGCFSCGRCFASCPREQLRWRTPREGTTS